MPAPGRPQLPSEPSRFEEACQYYGDRFDDCNGPKKLALGTIGLLGIVILDKAVPSTSDYVLLPVTAFIEGGELTAAKIAEGIKWGRDWLSEVFNG